MGPSVEVSRGMAEITCDGCKRTYEFVCGMMKKDADKRDRGRNIMRQAQQILEGMKP